MREQHSYKYSVSSMRKIPPRTIYMIMSLKFYLTKHSQNVSYTSDGFLPSQQIAQFSKLPNIQKCPNTNYQKYTFVQITWLQFCKVYSVFRYVEYDRKGAIQILTSVVHVQVRMKNYWLSLSLHIHPSSRLCWKISREHISSSRMGGSKHLSTASMVCLISTHRWWNMVWQSGGQRAGHTWGISLDNVGWQKVLDS